MKRLTGAKMLATAPEATVLEDGGKRDFHWGREYWFPPVKVDLRLADGQTLTLGGSSIKVHLHPGHTRGSVSYSLIAREGERYYTVLIANIGTINNGVRPTANNAYPTIDDDYALTFERQKALHCDIFLASHAGQYGLHDKYKPGMAYDPNRFVDAEGYRRAVEAAEAAFLRQLAAERGDDRAKIAEMRRVDTIATRDGDTDVLMDLLDDEIVALMPGNDPVVGKPAVRKLMEQYAAAATQFETWATCRTGGTAHRRRVRVRMGHFQVGRAEPRRRQDHRIHQPRDAGIEAPAGRILEGLPHHDELSGLTSTRRRDAASEHTPEMAPCRA